MQAGELMHGTLAQALYAQPGVRRVINLCGATEDTVYSVIYEVPKGASENPPIGKAFDNHEAYVLDARLQPVPAGVPGDLYYAGLGLAREYFKRPELTRKRFVSNPFKTSPYPRLYRSGDICRYPSDGDLEYISRADDSSRYAAIRVEINEIEAQLAAHPAIAEIAVARATLKAATSCWWHTPFCARATGRFDGRCAKFAADRLPEYMIPSSLVVLPELPRSAPASSTAAPFPNRSSRVRAPPSRSSRARKAMSRAC